jgi:hypothetical protein
MPVVGIQIWPVGQVIAVPPQTPLVHTSVVVHKLLSLQAVPLDLGVAARQPCTASHTDAFIQAVAAGQDNAIPAVQTPLWHVSAPLQRSASAQLVPSVLFDQAVVLWVVLQDWHAFAGFTVPLG